MQAYNGEREFIPRNESFERKLARRKAYRDAYFLAFPEYWDPPETISPIFLVGMGRSGTMMLANLLNLCEDVVAYHEPQPRLWHLHNAVHADPQNEKWPELFWAAKRDLVSVIDSNGYTYAECNWFITPFVYAIEKLFRKPKYVFVLRDLDGFVKSATNWGWYRDDEWNPEGRLAVPIEIKDQPNKLAYCWVTINRMVENFLLYNRIPEERRFVLFFDTLVNQDVEAIGKLFSRFDLSCPSEEEIKRVLSSPEAQNVNPRKGPIDKTWDSFDIYARQIMGTARTI